MEAIEGSLLLRSGKMANTLREWIDYGFDTEEAAKEFIAKNSSPHYQLTIPWHDQYDTSVAFKVTQVDG